MRRLLMLVALIATPATWADDLAQPVTAMLYWQKPLDGAQRRDSASTFGFRLDRAPVVNSVVLRKPIVDVRFNERGFHSLAFRGSVLHQNQPASGGPAPEINWWIVGGILAGSALLIANDEHRFKKKQQAQQKCTPTIVPAPAPGVGFTVACI